MKKDYFAMGWNDYAIGLAFITCECSDWKNGWYAAHAKHVQQGKLPSLMC